MNTKLIVIVGITGTQGASVADVFLNEPNWRVRGLTRDPSKPAAEALKARGVEMVGADIGRPETLTAAFSGAHAIYAITDFWQPYFNPGNKEKLKEGQTMNEFCFDHEVRHGENMANAAAKVETLERYVWSSLSDAKKWSKGKYTWVYHFDGKAKVTDYIKDALPDLAKKMSVLQIGLYATHWQASPFLAPKKQADGSFVLVLTADPDKPMPMIDTRRDTGYFVRALVQSPPEKNVLAYGSMISWKDYMTLWAQILELPGGYYRQVPVDLFDEKVPGGLGREVGEGGAYQGEYGYDGGDPSIVHPKDLGIDNLTTSIEDYIKREDWSSLIGDSKPSL